MFSVLCRLCCWCAVVCLVTTPLNAEIQIPSKSQPYKPIVAKVLPSNVPENAQVRGSVTCPTAELLQGSSPGVWHVWAAPGTHVVTATGVWVLTRDVQLGDEVVPVLVDFGQYTESAAFAVGDTPGPTPPPIVTGERLAVIYESSKRTPAQANLFALMRDKHSDRFITVDYDRRDSSAIIRQYADLVKDKSELPVVLIIASDQSFEKAPLPSTVTELEAMLDD